MGENPQDIDTPRLPIDIIVTHLLMFLDRTTFDTCIGLNREIFRLSQNILPHWPKESSILLGDDDSCQQHQPKKDITCMDISTHAIACGCQDGDILLILRRNGKRISLFPTTTKVSSSTSSTTTSSTTSTTMMPPVAITALTFSDDGRQLAIGRVDGFIQIIQFHDMEENDNHVVQEKMTTTNITTTTTTPFFRWKNEEEIHRNMSCMTLHGWHSRPVHSLTFCGGGGGGGRDGGKKKDQKQLLISTSEHDPTCIWETTHRRLVGYLSGYQVGFSAIALSPNEDMLAGIDWEGCVCLYPFSDDDLLQHGTFQSYRLLQPGLVMTSHLQFSTDGKTLFGIRNGDLQRWEVDTGIHHSVVLSNGSRTISTLNRDGTVHAHYDNRGLITTQSIDGPISQKQVKEQRWRMVFSPDGRFLVAGGVDGRLELWDIYQPKFKI